MQSKIYFIFVVFLFIVVQSISIDLYKQKDSKTNYDDDDDDEVVFGTAKYDYQPLSSKYRSNDYQTQSSTNRLNDYSPQSSTNRLNDYSPQSSTNRLNDYQPQSSTNRLNDYQSQSSTYRRNKYSPYGSSSNNYRSQSRWPSSSLYDDKYDSNDWSPYEYGLGNILSDFPGPLQPPAFESGRYLSNGPNCYPLFDPQYPLFSDICGAVQARYSLPNAFGHFERWQIAQILTGILGPATPTSANPVCARSLRLLLCPLLFPPCPTRYEAPPVLPCQPFCRVVKNQCAAPALELLPCHLLPPTSDICPINPMPYSSLLSSFGQPLPLSAGLPPAGLPPPSLSSILAQTAFLAGLSPVDIPPATLSASIPWSPYSSALTPPGAPSPAFPSSISQSSYPSGLTPPPSVPSPAFPSSMSPSPYSSPLTPPGAPSPAFQSLNSPLSYPSPLTPPGVPSPAFSSLLSSSGVPQLGMQSLLSPLNSFFSTEPFSMADSLTPILVDFPPIQYAQNYRQASRYFPMTRSATEKV